MRSAILRAATTRSSLLARPLGLSSPSLAAARPALVQSTRWMSSVVEVPIPELGAESIVEGGILALSKGPGDYVAFEEMVAEIETGAFAAAEKQIKIPHHQIAAKLTARSLSLSLFVPLADKVTIEAKSPHAGTIKKVYVEIGQTVEVGNPFFSIAVGEGEATVAVPAAAAAAPAAEPAAAAAAPAVAAAAPAAAGRIHPSGKPSLIAFPLRGAAAAAAPKIVMPAAAAATSTATKLVMPAAMVGETDLPMRFRRRPISEEEMDAVMTGGADFTFKSSGW